MALSSLEFFNRKVRKVKLKKLIIFVLTSTLLVSCTNTPTPFLDVTTTPTPLPQIEFTARLSLSAPNGDVVQVYAESVKQDFTSKNKPDMSLFGVDCAVIPSGGDVCYDKDTDILISTLSIELIESGHWCATQTGDDYTEPVPCGK